MHDPIFSPELISRAAKIRCLICDVDGVLSDGKVFLGNNGEELKSFNIKDGLGIKLLLKYGVEIAIITGRESQIVKRRADELGIKHVYQKQKDKIPCYEKLRDALKLSDEQIAYIGDDLPDAPLIRRVGLGVCVADAYPALFKQSDYCTKLAGGQGAVRELADLILSAQNKLDEAIRAY